MKKQITAFLAAFAILATAGTTAFADDDDDFKCTAEVKWNETVYNVIESDDSMREMDKEVIEEACDQACSHIIGDDDPCEHKCESEAVILSMKCTNRMGQDVKVNHPHHDAAVQPHHEAAHHAEPAAVK